MQFFVIARGRSGVPARTYLPPSQRLECRIGQRVGRVDEKSNYLLPRHQFMQKLNTLRCGLDANVCRTGKFPRSVKALTSRVRTGIAAMGKIQTGCCPSAAIQFVLGL